MNALSRFVFRPNPAREIALVRVATGAVFVVSGALKFLYANQGPARFARIGLPTPEVLSSFVGAVEIAAGMLLVLGLLTRLAAVPLTVDMLVAIATTKLPLLWGAGAEVPAGPPRAGFWAFAYASRLDVTMLLLCAYLFIAGAGVWSLDAYFARKNPGKSVEPGGAAVAPA